MPLDSSNIITQLITHLLYNARRSAHYQAFFARPMSGMMTAILVSINLVLLLISTNWRTARRWWLSRKGKKLFEEKSAVYHEILQQYIPYYRQLVPEQQARFLRRTLVFMSIKTFEFVEMEEEEHMPLLISAAAVQLTFGLHNYQMAHFNKIYVMKGDYRYGLFNMPFQGHVNHNGIYLSWNNFLRAYENYTDGDNVGLHEMAHALAYVNFTANNGVDEGFKSRFYKFSRIGRAVFNRVQDGEVTLLGSYAATNYQEFWAVCVENFFERPEAFKNQLPELYDAMCNLLNQDMLNGHLLLRPVVEV